MTSFVTSFLQNSALKSKYRAAATCNTTQKQNQRSTTNSHGHNTNHHLERLPGQNLSAPTLSSSSSEHNTHLYAYHSQQHYNTEYIHAPPPYDNMGQYPHQYQLQTHQQHVSRSGSPSPTPTTSWTSEMNALAQKIKDDVTSTFLSKTHKRTSGSNTMSNCSNITSVDRHSISQGMKLVSIAADEYDSGNETVALGVYLTGVDKLLMALPNKTDSKTKLAIKEKLQSVEERVGLIALANSQKKRSSSGNQDTSVDAAGASITVQSLLLSRLAQTISTVTNKAYQKSTSAAHSSSINNDACTGASRGATMSTLSKTGMHHPEKDSMVRFKQFGQCMIDFTVACAVIIKKSPIPGILSFLVGYMIQIFLWIDSQYHVIQKAQNLGIQCLKFGLEADEKYRLHEFVAEGFYMIFAAGLKAAIAYKEAPAHTHKESSIADGDIGNVNVRTRPTPTTFDEYTCTNSHMNSSQSVSAPMMKESDATVTTSWTHLFTKKT